MKRAFSLLLLFIIFMSPIQAWADIPAAPIVDSQSVILINGHTGEKIYAKKSETKISTDTLLPVIVTLVAMDNKTLDDYIIVEDLLNEEEQPTSNSMKLYSGEKLMVKELITLILLSGNDNALHSIATGIAGSEGEFARLCQEKAAALNLNYTKITGVTKKTSRNDYTTVNDLALAMKELMRIPGIPEILKTTSVKFNPTNIAPEVRTLDNCNLQIYPQSDDYYERAVGGIIAESGNKKKSGQSRENDQDVKTEPEDGPGPVNTNNSFVTMAVDGDQSFIIAVAQSKKMNDSYKNTRVLFDWAFNNYITEKMIPAGTKLQEWPLKNGEILDLVAGEDFYHTVKKTEANVLESQHVINYKPLETDGNSYKKGQLMGMAEITINDINIGSVPLLASRDVEIVAPDPNLEPTEFDFVKLWMIRIGLAVLLLTLIILIIRTYNKMKRSRVKQARLRKRRKEYLAVKRTDSSSKENGISED